MEPLKTNTVLSGPTPKGKVSDSSKGTKTAFMLAISFSYVSTQLSFPKSSSYIIFLPSSLYSPMAISCCIGHQVIAAVWHCPLQFMPLSLSLAFLPLSPSLLPSFLCFFLHFSYPFLLPSYLTTLPEVNLGRYPHSVFSHC